MTAPSQTININSVHAQVMACGHYIDVPGDGTDRCIAEKYMSDLIAAGTPTHDVWVVRKSRFPSAGTIDYVMGFVDPHNGSFNHALFSYNIKSGLWDQEFSTLDGILDDLHREMIRGEA